MRTILQTLVAALLLGSLSLVRADLIECDNGDRYHGKVLSMDAREVKLQNDIAGTLTIPRQRIVGIRLGAATAALPAPPAPSAPPAATALTQRRATNAPTLATSGLQFDAASIERIQNEYLATATPEATALFQELLGGMQSGRMNLGDLRAQAATTLKDLRAAQQEAGADALGGLLEEYGEVLESFLRQTQPGTRAPAIQPARPQPRTPTPR